MANPPDPAATSIPDSTGSARSLAPVRFAMVVALLAVVFALMAALAGFGSRWELWTFRTGFSMLRWAAYGGMAVVLLSLVALVAVRRGPRRGALLALFALAVGLVLVVIPWQWQARARSVPPIHDITTDTENPPEFVSVAPLRADAPNSMEYGGPEVAAQQRAAYPDIRPLLLDVPMATAFDRALEAVEEMDWRLVAADSTAGRIEATDQTFWFGFKDDIVIRLAPIGARTVVDVRSLSRVGGGDAGTNAGRIRGYLDELR